MARRALEADCRHPVLEALFAPGERVSQGSAIFDKAARYHLPYIQRLQLQRLCRRRERFNATDKQRVRRIVHFFEGRK
ncbi:hypothetical protein [Pseudomonas sp. SCB32]|uniref:hypothetical protein n=1 Tax=Pseudomonas sp. SCB32 TaxID=2653853 RepID=UPI0012643AAA|nr:hypothetical protein [Pseudomonas sp. SCB32]